MNGNASFAIYGRTSYRIAFVVLNVDSVVMMNDIHSKWCNTFLLTISRLANTNVRLKVRQFE